MTDLPTLADADTGFGEVLNLARTVQMFEDAGISAIHIEDQVNPKRCGHLDGKSVVGDEQAQQRIASAVKARRDPNFQIFARTDIRGVEGLDQAVARARMLQAAGADAIFAEAMANLDEFAAIRKAVDIPILANMTEFGKSELFTASELEKIGINIVIYPVSLLRLAMGAAERGLKTLKSEGSLKSEVSNMQTRSRLYELLDYENYQEFDNSVFNFKLGENQ
jgi:methylisocitrate lyase